MKSNSALQHTHTGGDHCGNGRQRTIYAIRFVLLAFLAFGISTLSARASVTINCNNYPDATNAINDAVSSPPLPDHTIILEGTCNISAPITGFATTGTSSKPIVLEGSGNQATIIQGYNSGSSRFPFDEIQVDNSVTLDKATNDVEVVPANYVTVTNLTINGGVSLGPNGADPGCSEQVDGGATIGDTGSGVEVVTGSNILLSDLKIQNVVNGVYLMGTNDTSGTSGATVTGVTVNGAQGNGIYLVGKGSCTTDHNPPVGLADLANNNVIESNTVENVSQYSEAGLGQIFGSSAHGWDGIDTELATNTTIQGNTLGDEKTAGSGDDIIVNCKPGGGYLIQVCNGNQVNSNKIYNSLNVGIDFAGQQENFTIENNIISTTNWGGIEVNGPMTVANPGSDPWNQISGNILTNTAQGDSAEGYPGRNATSICSNEWCLPYTKSPCSTGTAQGFTGPCQPGIPYPLIDSLNYPTQYCTGINIHNSTQFGAGPPPVDPQYITVKSNQVGTAYIPDSNGNYPDPPNGSTDALYAAICVYPYEDGEGEQLQSNDESTVNIVNNNFCNRTTGNRNDLYIGTGSQAMHSGNAEGCP